MATKVQEGGEKYEYGWLDKAIRVTENGRELAKFEYRNNGQLARAMRGNDIETFEWDGLALTERNGTKYINEPPRRRRKPHSGNRRQGYRSDRNYFYRHAWDKLR